MRPAHVLADDFTGPELDVLIEALHCRKFALDSGYLESARVGISAESREAVAEALYSELIGAFGISGRRSVG